MQKTNGRESKIVHFEMTSFVDVPKSKFSLILDIYVLVYEIVVTCPSINYEYLYYVTHLKDYVYNIFVLKKRKH